MKNHFQKIEAPSWTVIDDIFSTNNVVVMNLRKACNHPYLFNGAEPLFDGEYKLESHIIENSGKMIVLDKLLSKLKSQGDRVLVLYKLIHLLIVSDILSDDENDGYITRLYAF